MASQVGHGEVAIVPTIKGFRSAVSAEVDATTKQAKGVFEKGFASTGTDAGNTTGKGFHQAFSGQTSKTTADLTKSITRDVAKASRDVAQARLREQDSAGKVRLAETQLAEARSKYASGSSQVVRAEERLQSAQRELASRQGTTKEATDRLKSSQSKLATETDRVEKELREAARAAGMSVEEFRKAGAGANSATAEMSSAGSSGASGFMGSMKGGLTKVGGVVLGALLAANIAGTVSNVVGDAVRSGLEYVKESISIASDLEQSIGAVDQVFKENSGTIQKWAQEAAQNVGLSTGKYQEFATVVGSQLKNLGVPMGEVTDKTGGLISLGADLAAQFGGSTSEAVSALSSVLRGERDPIERYGVSIKQADINSRLAAKGLSDLEGEARKNAEITETLALLYEQTADAQGTFGRESDTLAGQQQRLTAEWENAQSKLGMSLLPALTELAKLANDELVPVLNDVIDKVGPELGAALAEAAPAIGEMLVELAPLIPEILELATEALPPLVDLLTVLAPLFVTMADVAGINVTTLGNLFDLISGDTSIAEIGEKLFNTSEIFRSLAFTVGTAMATVKLNLDTVKQSAAEMATGIGVKINEAIVWITSLPGRASAALGNTGELLVNSGKEMIRGFIRGINNMIDEAGQAASNVVEWVRGFFPFSPAKRGPLAGAGWSRLASSGEAYISQWTSGVEDGAARFRLPDLVRNADAMSVGVTPLFGAFQSPAGGEVRHAGRGDVKVEANFYESKIPARVALREMAREVKAAM